MKCIKKREEIEKKVINPSTMKKRLKKREDSRGGRDVPFKKKKECKDFTITRHKWIILHGMWTASGSRKARKLKSK